MKIATAVTTTEGVLYLSAIAITGYVLWRMYSNLNDAGGWVSDKFNSVGQAFNDAGTAIANTTAIGLQPLQPDIQLSDNSYQNDTLDRMAAGGMGA